MFSNPFPGIGHFRCEKISSSTIGLHPRELALAGQFKAEKRRNEFLTGRRCAQFALQAANIPNLPVLRAATRSPQWPFSIVGSITHGAGYAAALLCRSHNGIVGVGLDMEDLGREIKTDISRHVLTNNEASTWLKNKKEVCEEVRLIFSIKEAIYKCFFPLAGTYLGFHDAEVDEINETGFKARLLKSPLSGSIPLPLRLQGTLAVKDSIVLSAVKITFRELTANRQLL